MLLDPAEMTQLLLYARLEPAIMHRRVVYAYLDPQHTRTSPTYYVYTGINNLHQPTSGTSTLFLVLNSCRAILH